MSYSDHKAILGLWGVQALVAELKLANCISSTIISLLKYNKTHTISFANFEKKKCCLST